MLINEILNELTFGGSRCTKDCSGHKAGFRWALRKGKFTSNSKSPSFDAGVKIGGAQMATGILKTPKIRDPKGRFYFNPK